MTPPLAWSLTLAMLLVGAVRARLTASRLMSPQESGGGDVVPRSDAWPTADSLIAAADAAAESDPFGTAAVAVPNVAQTGAMPPGPMPPPRPPFILLGILGGPPWSAVVSGIPNTMGPVLLRMGDTVGGYSIARVSRDTLVLKNGTATHTLAFGAR